MKYGTNSNELNMTSGQQHSGDNIRVLDKEYSIELSDLLPCVTYYYSVVSSNTAGSAASGLRTFTTRESELI